MKIQTDITFTSVRVSILIAVGLFGCTVEDRSEYTVDYYKDHADEREATLAKCNNDPGHLRSTPQCVNARQAALRQGMGTLRNLPPMGLLDDENEARTEQSAD